MVERVRKEHIQMRKAGSSLAQESRVSNEERGGHDRCMVGVALTELSLMMSITLYYSNYCEWTKMDNELLSAILLLYLQFLWRNYCP